MTRSDPRSPEHSYQTCPQPSPRQHCPLQMTLELRQLHSEDDKPSENASQEPTMVGPDRNSSNPINNAMSKTVPFQNYETRQNSALTNSTSERNTARAWPRSRSELRAERPTTFDAVDGGPLDTTWRPPTDGLLPFDMSSSERTGGRRSSHFGTTLPTTGEETSKADGLPRSLDSQSRRARHEASWSSEDGRCRKSKHRRRCTVGSAAEKAMAFSAELRRRSTATSTAESGSSDF